MLLLLKNYWRKLLALVVLAVAFFGGRLSVPDKPAKVITETKTEVREVEKRVLVKADDQKVIVYRDRLTKPDGTTIEHEVSKTISHEREAETDDRSTQSLTTSHTEVTQQLPQWRAGLLLGLDARDVKLLPPTLGKPVVGALVERRIIGGFSAGAWVLSAGPTVGVGLTYEF